MAVVKPFCGIRYNLTRFDQMQTVVSQPYDRIDGDLQDKYYALSPYNVVRIIWGKTEDGDQPTNPAGPNVYTRARFSTVVRRRCPGPRGQTRFLRL
jgi:hypothetical protein